ncbi:UNVERIFIED_CONTAM: hypothetical protein PYX00_000956 [Menopon gallinae]|uniref:Cullin-2 n=1 Tax=Menopon gallinae TaxID=328185 RepID=A0AAW2IB31_9NEOP
MSLKPKKVNFTATWSLLQETLKGVITLGDVPRSIWNDSFTDVYSLCVARPEPLADRLYQETKKFLDDHVKQLYEKVRTQGSQENIGLLKAYLNAWLEYSQGIIYLHKLYLYLNQQHIKKQKFSEAEITLGSFTADPTEQMEIGELGLEIWKEHMIEPLRPELVRLLLERIEDDRKGIPSVNPTDAIRDIIQSFVHVQSHKDLGFELCQINSSRVRGANKYYQEVFEIPFLIATGEFYKREAAKLLQECTISEYLEKVQQKLNEEAVRVRKFVHVTSYAKVKAECETHFVSDHLSVLHSECVQMVKEERKQDLKNLYSLLKGVPNGLPFLVDQFLQNVKNEGLNAISNLQGDNIHIQFVDNMLHVHKKYKDLIEEVFCNDKLLVGALDKACAQVINQKSNPKMPCRSPEWLAKYCDTLLKKSSKGLSDSEIDEKLTKSITIFKYIDDKDVYQKLYSKMLARRLIHQQSQSMDAEEGMINRLKQACGYEFTNKLHRMYTDISLSADLNVKFQEYLKKRPNVDLGINFQINVLQAGAWPLGQGLSSFNLPQELEKSVQIFEEFYKSSFSGRKLSWYHHLCQGEIKLTYLKKPYIISMQTFQMAILLLFEKTDELTGREIQDGTQLSGDQLQKQLQSLTDAKLLKDPGTEPTLDTTYVLNLDYSNKRTRLKISGALQRETPQEIETTLHRVEEDRKLYLQAAIVRIMKSRKLLKHNRLIQEVLAQSGTSFQLSIAMIKQCIEALIDKQYIERTPNSQDEYSYVA